MYFYSESKVEEIESWGVYNKKLIKVSEAYIYCEKLDLLCGT